MNDFMEILYEIENLEHRLSDLRASARREMIKEEVGNAALHLFLVEVGSDLVGIPVHMVEEVLPMCKLVTCPESPPWLPGLLNFRGKMLPAIDVKARIDKRQREPALGDFIVVCDINGYRFCLIVQRLHHIAEVHGDEMQEVAAELPHAPYVLGVFRFQDRALFLLSISCLLSISKIQEELVE